MKKALTILAVLAVSAALGSSTLLAEVTSTTVSEEVIEGPAVLRSVHTNYHTPVVSYYNTPVVTYYDAPVTYRTATYYRPGYSVVTYGPTYRRYDYRYPTRHVVVY